MHFKVAEKYFCRLPAKANKRVEEFRCKFCPKTYAKHATRMTDHLIYNCRNCPKAIRKIVQDARKSTSKKRKREESVDSGDDTENVPPASLATTSLSDGEFASPSNRLNVSADVSQASVSDSKLDKFFDNMGKKEQSHAEKLLAKAIFASGTPLAIVENRHWQDFMAFVRPSFNLPSRHQVAKPLLEDIYEEVKNKVTNLIAQAPSVAIQCVGWSNIRREGIINFVVTTPKPVFYHR